MTLLNYLEQIVDGLEKDNKIKENTIKQLQAEIETYKKEKNT